MIPNPSCNATGSESELCIDMKIINSFSNHISRHSVLVLALTVYVSITGMANAIWPSLAVVADFKGDMDMEPGSSETVDHEDILGEVLGSTPFIVFDAVEVGRDTSLFDVVPEDDRRQLVPLMIVVAEIEDGLHLVAFYEIFDDGGDTQAHWDLLGDVERLVAHLAGGDSGDGAGAAVGADATNLTHTGVYAGEVKFVGANAFRMVGAAESITIGAAQESLEVSAGQ